MSRKFLAAVLILLFMFCIPSFSQTTTQSKVFQKIQWEPVEGAAHYLVEVADSSAGDGEYLPFISEETQDSQIEVQLLPGDYVYRVSVFNTFSKLVISTNWNKLSVKVIQKPILFSSEVPVLFEGFSEFEMKILADNLNPSDRFYIKRNQETIYQPLVVKLAQDSVILKIISKNLTAGTYSIIVESLEGFKDELKDILQIRTAIKPNILSITPIKFYSGQYYPDIVIDGTNFENGLKLIINNSEIVAGNLSIQTNKIRFWLDLQNALAGNFVLEVENPGGKRDSIKLTIVKLKELSEKTDDRLGVTVTGKIPIFTGDTTLDDYTGLTGAGFDFYIDYGGKIPWINWSGFGISTLFFDTGLMTDVNPNNIANEFFLLMSPNIYTLTRFKSPVNLFLSGGVGLSLHKYFFEEGYTDPYSEYYSMLPGIDLNASIAMDLNVYQNLVLRIGGRIDLVYAVDGIHYIPTIYAEAGWIFVKK